MPAPADFSNWSRDDQLAYLYRTYGGTIEDRQRAAGGTNALASGRFRQHNIATADYVSPEERALWAQVKPAPHSFVGGLFADIAPVALPLALAYIGGTALMGANGLGAAGAASTSGAASGSGLGIFANGGAAGMAGVGAGNAGALAASGAIGGGAGIAGTTAGALGALSRGANALSGAGNSMGWDWGRILDYGAPIIGGLLESQGAKDAARASSAASAAGIAETRRQYDQTRADMMPWLQAGTSALGRLNDPNAFTASPDYNFRRTEGMRGIENSFAARGGALSGNALRALTDFNSGLAGSEYGNWWNRTASQAGLGQTAAQNLGAFGANNSANVANLLGAQGDARASGITGQTNALTGLLQNLSSVWNRRNQGTYG